MIKKIAIALGVLLVLAVVVSYNLWRATQDPVTTPPGPYELGKQHLHSQLEDAKRNELEAEKQNWNSAAQLRKLVQWHQQRMDKLTANKQADEIVAYDKDSIDRLNKRIADLDAQAAAKAQAEAEAEKQATQAPHPAVAPAH